MKKPIILTRTFLELNSMIDVSIKEFPKFIGNCSYMNLKRIRLIIKDLPYKMYRVYNNYDFSDVLNISGLIYTTPYSEQFSFSSSDIDCIIDHFDNLFIMNMNIGNRSGNLILDASIKYYKSNQRIQRESESNTVKEINIYFKIYIALSI